MSRDYTLYLEDIHTACEKIQRYTKNLSKSEFIANELHYDAVIRNLEIIGEAAKKIPENVQLTFQDIEWRKMAGLRDIIAHAYFGLDDDIVWDIVTTKIPDLYKNINDFKNKANQ